MTSELALGAGAEFDAIRGMLAQWGRRATGIGDDAAVIHLPRGDSLVTSVDAAVEDVHFRRDWLSPREIGYRAVAAAMSDLAAMAARPVGMLIAISAPAAWRAALDELAQGIGDASDSMGAPVIGGNLTAAAELTITTTVFGAAFAPLRRRGAAVGDLVYVTGALGGAGESLRRLLAGEPAGEYRERFAHPVPRLAEARWLGDHGATSAIDLSDGLLADIGHLAAAGGVSIAIDERSVPVLPGIERRTGLSSGEEYELIVTCRAAVDATEFVDRFGVALTSIGIVAAGEAGSVTLDGERVVDALGHDHFSR